MKLLTLLVVNVVLRDAFFEIFDDLINELSKEGIYNPSIPILKTYCENGDPEV